MVEDDRRALQTIFDVEVLPYELPTDKDSNENMELGCARKGAELCSNRDHYRGASSEVCRVWRVSVVLDLGRWERPM
jgi:hypothetical protein